MKKWITVFMTGCLLYSLHFVSAQSYTFTDRKIPENWYGNQEHFVVSSMSQLQLQAPEGSGSSYLSWTAPDYTDCLWEYYIQYTFSASTSNYASFYVFSQQQDPAASGNKGYYLKIGGETGSLDKVRLYYQDGLTHTQILESSAGLAGASALSLRIRLYKTSSGSWTLYADSTGGHSFIKQAHGTHNSNELFSYSALRCLYSSTRRSNFYFDDIEIAQPFAIQSYAFEDSRTLRILFTKQLATEGVYSVSSAALPAYTISANDSTLHLIFEDDVRANQYALVIHDLYSIGHDTLFESVITIEKSVVYYTGQVRITEVMADPVPSYGLPASEYIELMNTGTTSVNLSAFRIKDPTSTCALASYILSTDSTVILCPKDMCSLFKRSNCMELPCFLNLNNDKDSIMLLANDTILSDALYYNSGALANDDRKNGGYAIVRTSLPSECMIDQSITFSSALAGGTPGIKDVLPVRKEIVFHAESVTDTSFILHSNVYGRLGDHALLWPAPYTVVRTKNECDWMITLSKPISKGTAVTGMIHSFNTCRGETKILDNSFTVTNAGSPARSELYINEVLYNPLSGGVDFIELVNVSVRYLQLQHLHVYHTGNKTSHQIISYDLVIAPLSYAVFTSDTSMLFQQVNHAERSRCYALNPFPSLPDEGGELFLISSSDTLDHVWYGDVFHNPLSRDNEGISLEKINPFISTFESYNWTSSASGATPGYSNSQLFLTDAQSAKPLQCSPCHVTTNLNGDRDLVLLHLHTNNSVSHGSVTIFSLSGEKILELCSNQLLANENSFQWNGQSRGNTPLPDGIYIAVAEWWLPDGQKYESRIAISTSAH